MRTFARLRAPDGSLAVLGPGDIIGRTAIAALRINDPRISEAHALVSLRGTSLKLLALRGRFFIDHTPQLEVELRSGLVVLLAQDLAIEVVEVSLPHEVLGLEGPGLARQLLPSVVPGVTPARSTYPRLVLDAVPITDEHGVICGQYPLDDSDGAFETGYTQPATPDHFEYELSQLDDGEVDLGTLDDDHAPGQVNALTLGATMHIADRLGGFIEGSNRYFDLYDWKAFTLGSGLALSDFTISCTTGPRGDGQPALLVQLFDAAGQSLTGGFEPCGGELAIERAAAEEDATFYALVVAANPATPAVRFRWRFFAACLDVMGVGEGCFGEAWYLTVGNPYELDLVKK